MFCVPEGALFGLITLTGMISWRGRSMVRWVCLWWSRGAENGTNIGAMGGGVEEKLRREGEGETMVGGGGRGSLMGRAEEEEEEEE